MTSLTWGSHLLPTGLSFCLGCMAGVPASSCATAVDVSGHGTAPHPGWTHPRPCLTVVLLTPGLSSSPSPGRCPGLEAGATSLSPAAPAPEWRWDKPVWEDSALLPHGAPQQLPVLGSSRHPWHPACQVSQAASSPKPAVQSQACSCTRPCPTNLALGSDPLLWFNPSQQPSPKQLIVHFPTIGTGGGIGRGKAGKFTI